MMKARRTAQEDSIMDNDIPIEISGDELDIMRKDPKSSRGRECKMKILHVLLNDEIQWKQLKDEMHRANLHTNAAMEQLLNRSILVQTGAKMAKKCHEAHCEVDCARQRSQNVEKREAKRSTPLKPIRNILKSLENDEFGTKFRGMRRLCLSMPVIQARQKEKTTLKCACTGLSTYSSNVNLALQRDYGPALTASSSNKLRSQSTLDRVEKHSLPTKENKVSSLAVGQPCDGRHLLLGHTPEQTLVQINSACKGEKLLCKEFLDHASLLADKTDNPSLGVPRKCEVLNTQEALNPDSLVYVPFQFVEHSDVNKEGGNSTKSDRLLQLRPNVIIAKKISKIGQAKAA